MLVKPGPFLGASEGDNRLFSSLQRWACFMLRQIALLSLFTTGLFSQSDFQQVTAYLDQSVTNQTVAGGAVIVLHRAKVVFKTGFGYADVKSREQFKIQTPAILASISKPMLGTAAYRLSEAGKVNLVAPISRYLPSFGNLKLISGEALSRAPTLTELLTHTSGMRHDTAPQGRPWFAEWTQDQPLAVVVDRYAREFPFYTPPGTRQAYSGIGTDVAARVLEITSGRLRNALLQEEVCRPLGMMQTYYLDAQRVRQRPMPTRYYISKNGGLTVAAKRRMPEKNTYSSSGGTIISSASDLAIWLLMIRNQGRFQNKPFLKAESIKDMLRPNPVGSNAQGGFFVREKDAQGNPTVIGHTGSSGTNCWINFATDTIGIMITQTRGKDIMPFRKELQRRIDQCTARLSLPSR